ncbi:MAG: methylated-DNA--[protein]-cysteine S-methyltransferase [Candidatus Desulforudis sp.]|nr:methylated-DNA--[protein]-cysteine S-methyltransferase [Desulforudis sp.]
MKTVLVQLPVGWIGFHRTEAGLFALTLPEISGAEALNRLWAWGVDKSWDPPGHALDDILVHRLGGYFAGRRVDFSDVPIDWSGYSPFGRTVLEACRKVPFGRTITYTALAREVGKPRAARAVGNALGANRTPLVVPCHRIVRSDGSPGGFTGGAEWKRRLLLLEGRTDLYRG